MMIDNIYKLQIIKLSNQTTILIINLLDLFCKSLCLTKTMQCNTIFI